MKEILRQFVLFGNFNNVTFESVYKLEKLKEKYGFQVNAMPDIVEQKNPLQVTVGVPVSRPIFQSADKKMTVFFGTKRIHIEQVDTISETFEDFNAKAIDITSNLLEILDIKVTRIALNGQLFCNSEKAMSDIYNSIFNKSDLYSDDSKEWQIRVCSKENVETLGCEVNKITQFIRGDFIDNNGVNQKGLIAVYDYNTQAISEKIFNKKEIIFFNDLAKQYRKLFIR